MKIMIPASGGLDSTVMLAETLRNTSHEVVAVFYDEDYLFDDTTAQRTAFDAVTAWLASNVRALEVRIGETKYGRPSGLPYDRAEEMPFLPGGTNISKTFWLCCRYASHGHNATAIGSDEVWLSLTTNNRRHSTYPGWGAKAMRAYSDWAGDIPLRTPWIEKRADGNVYGRGRIENRRAIDPALYDLVHVDSMKADVLEAFETFYNEFCRNATDAQIAVIAERIERRACFGRYAVHAVAETYNHLDFAVVIGDLEDWRAWDAAGRPEADPP